MEKSKHLREGHQVLSFSGDAEGLHEDLHKAMDWAKASAEKAGIYHTHKEA